MNRINKIFTESLLNWYIQEGRKDLPWQQPPTAYRVWISEIMLQQTQVQTVIPYFLRFMQRFPDIYSLAQAASDTVLSLWSGLGYYARARNLHRTAQVIVSDFGGEFPHDLATLESLPGIGRSTAAAIASLAFDKKTAIMDANVQRVLSRYFLIGAMKNSDRNRQLWQQAQACMPSTRCREYTQAIMDMGALCCTPKQPNCQNCPLQKNCGAYQGKVVAHYPPPKIKNIRPLRQEQFLLLHTAGPSIYLEQRPAKGLWGGLWCLPNIGKEDCATTYLESHYQLVAKESQKIMHIKHGFTHFQLEITVTALKIALKPELPGRWIAHTELGTLGLAKPVRVIADHFFKQSLRPVIKTNRDITD